MLKKILVTTLFVLTLTIYGQNGIIAVGKTAMPPVIDGQLNDPCWRTCIEISNFIQYAGKSDLPKEKTQVYMTYDEANIYFAFKCYESHLNPVLNQRQLFKATAHKDKTDTLDVFKDDSIEIFLSCSNEVSNNYYQIAINSLGTIYDAHSSKGKTWNSGATARGKIGSEAWTLEVAIPIKNLSPETTIIPGKSCWHGNFCRNTKPVKEISSWNRATAKGFHSPAIFGKLNFVETVPGIKNVSFSPFKNGRNSLSAKVLNPFKSENSVSLSLNTLFDSTESVMTQESLTLPPGKAAKLTLTFDVNTSNNCITYTFSKQNNQTVTMARTGVLNFKPETEYIFKADVKSNYSCNDNKPYNFFRLQSEDGYKPIEGADVPLQTGNNWQQVKGQIKTGKQLKSTALWLVRWAERNMQGTVYIDNIRIIERNTGKNIIKNSGFQNGPESWPIIRKLHSSYGHSADNLTYSYSFRSGQSLLYQSPKFKRGLLIENEQISSQMVNFGYTGTYRIHGLSLAAGEPERVNLILKSNKADSIENVFFEINMPYSCVIRFPQGTSSTVTPTAVEERIEDGENGKRRHYKMTFSQKAVSYSNDLPWRYVTIPLVISSTGWKTEMKESTIRYKAWINNNQKENQFHKLKLELLPPLLGKQPKKLPLIIWAYSAMNEFSVLSKDLRRLFIEKMAHSGFNLSESRRELVNEYSPYHIEGFALLPTITISSGFPYTSEFIKKHPEYAAHYPNGKIASAIDPAYLLQDDCLFHDYMKKVFHEYLNFFPTHLDWDYEFGFMSHKSQRAKIGFSERNLAMFREYANIPNGTKLNADIIYSQYSDKWIDFRCWQNAKLAGLYRKLIKELKPDCSLSFYSGYPPAAAKHYGVKWKYTSKEVDQPMCGYGGNNELMLKTIQQKYFSAGLLLMSYTNQLPLENTIFNLLTEAGSYLAYVHFVLDGRFFLACSRAAAVAADFEDFFLNLKGNKHNELVVNQDGTIRKDVSVITNKNRRLLIINNFSQKEKELTLKNLSLADGMIGIDYDTKQIFRNPEKMTLKIAPWRVKAVYLCPEQELLSKPASSPSPLPHPDSMTPILRWNSSYSAIEKYDIKYGSSPALTDAVIANDIPHSFFQLSEDMLKDNKLYWQVRSKNLLNATCSNWSKTFCFTITEKPYSFSPVKMSDTDTFAKLGYWTRVSWGGGGSINLQTKDYAIKHGGDYSLKCSNFFDNSHSYWTNYRSPGSSTKLPKVQHGEEYQLSAWVKADGDNVKTSLTTSMLGEEGQKQKYFSKKISGTTDWKQVTLTFKIPKNATSFRILFSVDGVGTAWCSDIKLKKLEISK